jgi:hypothetical protein
MDRTAMAAAAVAAVVCTLCAPALAADAPETAAAGTRTAPIEYEIFNDAGIHFSQEHPGAYDTEAVAAEDNGRVIARTIDIALPRGPVRIEAVVATKPIPKDDLSVYDPWDRAGNVRLVVPGFPDVEIVKFVTAYGGVTEHAIDVSCLAPLLKGACTFKGFIDTWASPGWKMDFSLRFSFDDDPDASGGGAREATPDWVLPVLYEESVTAERLKAGGLAVPVEIPEGTSRVVMHYLVSGHCTDGTDADEFITKDNVVAVDGVEVARIEPWRDDCLAFRAVNPYTRRWSDGSWSSDYSRSGWCPGDKVPPIKLGVTGALRPGTHTIVTNVENVRPADDKGNFGYWRISSYLLGWRDSP